MGRDMSLDGWDFGLSKAHKHIIYTAFKDKFKKRKFSGLSAYVSRKDCENFIANSRATLKIIEKDPYTSNEFKLAFLEKYKFNNTNVFSEVYKYFKEALEIYWDNIVYNGKKFRKMFMTYN